MTKADIVDIIASGTGLTKVETEAVVDGFIQTVIASLRDGKNIEIRGFGSFKVKKRKGRMARNPRTGAKVYVPSKNVVTFKPGKEMEELVRKMDPDQLPLLEDEPDADEQGNGPIQRDDLTGRSDAQALDGSDSASRDPG